MEAWMVHAGNQRGGRVCACRCGWVGRDGGGNVGTFIKRMNDGKLRSSYFGKKKKNYYMHFKKSNFNSYYLWVVRLPGSFFARF